MSASELKAVWWFLIKTEICLLYDTTIPPLDIYPKDSVSYYRDTYMLMFVATLLTIARAH